MKLFILSALMTSVLAIFGERVISMFQTEVNSRSSSQCLQPCQRVSFKIKLSKALLLGGISPEYYPFIKSYQTDENDEIDIITLSLL